MASPMREKRAWPPQDKEDRAESIAFEQTVAVVRETVARSGQVLSSAKEDLTDHQRWLRDQAAAVQAHRARHDRWLQRQRERQEAFERREQARLRRRQRRQRAVQAVTGTISAVALSISSTVFLVMSKTVGGLNYIDALAASGIKLVVSKTVGGLNYIDALAASGIKWVGRQIRDSSLYVAKQVRDAVRYVANIAARGASWTGRTTADIVHATGRASSAAFSFVAAKVGTSAQATGRGLSSGLSFIGSETSAMGRSTGKALSAGSSAAAVKGAAMARSTSRALSAGSSFAAANSVVLARSTGSALSKGVAFTVTNATTLAREAGRIASASFAWTSTKVHEIASPVARFLSVCIEGIGARATDLSRAAGKGLSAGSCVVAIKTAAFTRAAGDALAPAFAWTRAKVYDVAPSVAERIGRARLIAHKFAREGAASLRTWFASAMPARMPLPASAEMEAEKGGIGASPADVLSPPLAATENALSLPRHIRGLELGQMLIVTGTVLLVLGCLMLGGGLILRAGTPAQVAPNSSPEYPDSLVWFFEAKDRPLAERSIFIFTGTPEGVSIKGFSISAENKSDQPLTGVSGILKPDVEGPDMPLSVTIDMPKGEASLAHPPEASAAEAKAAGIVPAHSVFRLIFPFPEEPGLEQQGVTPEEVVHTFGGLMLKVHYDVDGKEKAFMHYLSPAMLKEQLLEIEASAKGS